MFRDRVFNISFLISLGWHLFCIFAFVLVVTPKGFTLNKFPQTSFLGPIAEMDISQPAGRNARPVFMTTPYKEDFTLKSAFIGDISDYLDRRVPQEEDTERAKFIEPQENKQLPEFLNDKD